MTVQPNWHDPMLGEVPVVWKGERYNTALETGKADSWRELTNTKWVETGVRHHE